MVDGLTYHERGKMESVVDESHRAPLSHLFENNLKNHLSLLDVNRITDTVVRRDNSNTSTVALNDALL